VAYGLDTWLASAKLQWYVFPESYYIYLLTLQCIIKPLYRFTCDQGYDAKFVRKEKDHVSAKQWDRVFFKTYFEKHSTWHLLVNILP
jgi:hypothetical protein